MGIARSRVGRSFAFNIMPLALAVVVACSGGGASDDEISRSQSRDVDASAGASNVLPQPTSVERPATVSPQLPNYDAGPADTSRSIVRHQPRVTVAYAESSLPLASLPAPPDSEAEESEHEVMRLPRFRSPFLDRRESRDPVLQSNPPIMTIPLAIRNFAGQGNSTSPLTRTGTPPDTNGAVGPNHFVQTVNGGIEVWNKSGAVLAASKFTNALFAGYVGTNVGNNCAARNDGDPVVVYDQIADRWMITQFSLPNMNANAGPSFQCVAVSKTPDQIGRAHV